jgi:hypothetical protein
MHHRVPGITMLASALLVGALAGGNAQARSASARQTQATAAQTNPAADGARAFDFWMGSWKIHNHRLRARLAGANEWDDFEATGAAHQLPGGLGNEDEYHTQYAGGFVGLTIRFYNPATREWSLYWIDTRHPAALDPPVVGTFTGDVGTFYGKDTFAGKPILVRFIWSRTSTPTPHWEQAFSPDGGKTWETNWQMDMERIPDTQPTSN